MTITAEDFRTQRPEFKATAVEIIQAELANATAELAADVFGARLDEAISLLAAHKLAISPMGRRARLVNKEGTTTYESELNKLKRQMAPKFLVT